MGLSAPGTGRNWSGAHGSVGVTGDLLWLRALLVSADEIFIAKVTTPEL